MNLETLIVVGLAVIGIIVFFVALDAAGNIRNILKEVKKMSKDLRVIAEGGEE